MKHYHMDTFPFNKDIMPRTTVFKLIVEHMTGKIRLKRNDPQTPSPRTIKKTGVYEGDDEYYLRNL